MNFPLPAAVSHGQEKVVLVVAIPGEGILTGSSKLSAVVIQPKKSTVELSGELSDDLMMLLPQSMR